MCVVCHTKQSVVRIFGVSARAADIRALVQKYNMAGSGATSSRTSDGTEEEPDEGDGEDEEREEEEEDDDDDDDEEEREQVDKWAPFLVEEEKKKTPDAAEDPASGLAGRLAAAAERRERGTAGGPSREPASRVRVVRSTSSRRAAEPYTVPEDGDSDFETAAPPPPPSSSSTSKWARFL